MSDLYAAMSNYGAAGTIDDFRVPDVDLSAIQAAIVHLSLFQAANGTSLDAITPEVGGVWTEQSGDWDIQGNQARSVTGSNDDQATVSTNVSDAIIDAVITPSKTDGSNYESAGLICRWSDTNNFWLLWLRAGASEVAILEKNSGSYTQRAVISVTLSDNVAYDARMIADGQTIDGFLDGGNKISYASATLNETKKVHGIRLGVVGTPPGDAKIDNFATFPRTSSTYDSVLNGV